MPSKMIMPIEKRSLPWPETSAAPADADDVGGAACCDCALFARAAAVAASPRVFVNDLRFIANPPFL